MMEEEEECSEQGSSYSWWWDSHNHPHQSQWLQSTLSDLDKKIKMMLNLIEDDGESFVKRAEMYYKKRPELIKMVEDLHRSYRSLAEKYDHLRSDSTELLEPDSSTTLCNSFKEAQLPIVNKRSSEITKTEAPSSSSIEPTKNHSKKEQEVKEGADLCSLEREEMWTELRLNVSKLMEDHLRQQAELVRRNDAKRKAIKALRAHTKRIMEENEALKSRLGRNAVAVKQNQSQLSRLKGLILGKWL